MVFLCCRVASYAAIADVPMMIFAVRSSISTGGPTVVFMRFVVPGVFAPVTHPLKEAITPPNWRSAYFYANKERAV